MSTTMDSGTCAKCGDILDCRRANGAEFSARLPVNSVRATAQLFALDVGQSAFTIKEKEL